MEGYVYDAFISYRHVAHDKKIAERLQKLLETYRPPQKGSYRNTRKISRIFRDQSELPTSGNLGEDIKNALDNSAFLIVICSKETKQSKWCLKEIEYFKSIHNNSNDRILTLLVDGDPGEVFPDALRFEKRSMVLESGIAEEKEIELEPLAANVVAKNTKESLKKLKTEFLRIAAPILGCSFDELYRRHQKRFIRNVMISSVSIICFLVAFSSFSIYQATVIKNKKEELETAYTKTKEQQLFRTVDYAKGLAAEGDRTQAAAILSEAYDRFNTDSDSYQNFKDQIEVAMANTAYYPAYSPYMVMHQNGKIIAAAFSEDDTYLATASEDKTVVLWNVADGQKIYTLEHDSPIAALRFCGDYLITGTKSGDISIWNIKDGTLFQTYEEEYGILQESNDYDAYGVKNIACNNDINALVVSIFGDNGISYLSIIPYPWLSGGGKKQDFKVGSKFTVSDNGKYVVSTGEESIDFTLSIDYFDSSMSEEQNCYNMLRTVGANYSPSYGVSVDDAGYITFQSEMDSDLVVNVYQIDTDSLAAQFVNPTWGYTVVPKKEFDGTFVLTDDYDYRFAYLENGECKTYGQELQFSMTDINLSSALYIPNSNNVLITFSGNENSSYVYSMDSQKIAQLTSQNAPLSCTASNNTGSILLTASYDGEIVLHNVSERFGYYKEKEGSLSIQGLSKDLKAVSDNTVYDLLTGETLGNIQLTDSNYKLIDCIGWDADKNLLFGAEGNFDTNEYYLRIWDVRTGKITNTLDKLNSCIDSYTAVEQSGLSDNFKYLAAKIGNQVIVYSMDNDTITDKYDTYMKYACIHITDDGNTMYLLNAEGGNLSTVNLTDNKMVSNQSMDFYGNAIYRAYINTEDNRLIILPYTGTDITTNCDVYSISTGKKLFSLSDMNNSGYIWTVSQDATAAYSNNDSTEYIWNSPAFEDIVKDTKAMAGGRVLTEEERQNCGLNIFDN